MSSSTLLCLCNANLRFTLPLRIAAVLDYAFAFLCFAWHCFAFALLCCALLCHCGSVLRLALLCLRIASHQITLPSLRGSILNSAFALLSFAKPSHRTAPDSSALPLPCLATLCPCLAKRCFAFAWLVSAKPLPRYAVLCRCMASLCLTTPLHCLAASCDATPCLCHARRDYALPRTASPLHAMES